MSKLFIAFAIVLTQLFSSTPVPEIWGELIPYMETEIRQDYLAPLTKYSPGHRGIDIEIPVGDPVFSPESGTVSFVGLVVDRDVLTITTNLGFFASFEPICTNLQVGDLVQKGQEIGYHCAATKDYDYHCFSCVHESTRNPFGYLSPLYMMGKLRPSTLSA